MIEYYSGDVKRIQHFMKVHSFAKLISEMEQLDKNIIELIEITALVHDIGIKSAEEKYNSNSGKYQEIEGPPIAEKMLPKSFPTTYIIGKNGRILKKEQYASDWDSDSVHQFIDSFSKF